MAQKQEHHPTLASMLAVLVVAVAAWSSPADALYAPSDAVVSLTSATFEPKVVNSGDVWLVEFFAPWCGHCKALVPEYKKAAAALKGVVKVGAVDADDASNKPLASKYGVTGFPTILLFGAGKSPVPYQGQRTAAAIAQFVLQQAGQLVQGRLGGGEGSSGSGSGGASSKVIKLDQSNFDALVLKSKDIWMVEFFAPWCGHCKSLEPHWRDASVKLDGKVKLGAVDATVETALASKYGVHGYPTIFVFGAGGSSKDEPTPYEGGRTTSDIVTYAEALLADLTPPPEPNELVSQRVWDEHCSGSTLCIVAVLPDILDTGAKGRQAYLDVLRSVAKKHRRRPLAYLWTAAGEQADLEQLVGVGGFGYPAVAAVSTKKGRYATMRGAFTEKDVSAFITGLTGGKEPTFDVRAPAVIAEREPWDGGDGTPPPEDGHGEL